ARQELSGMDDVIIDVHYAELFDCDLIFIIRCSPDELYRRLSARGYGREKVRENVLSEILDTCLINAIETMGSGRVFEIVSGDMEENIDLIVDIVRNGGQGREVGSRSSVHYLTPENLELLDRI
ncbi:MAG TPA: AAA family ATPase, partial [Candidatus Methanofastidiosa archaeon]|nr:AAA family ATPase [Candidatus Methanofastidiosa archaeon]